MCDVLIIYNVYDFKLNVYWFIFLSVYVIVVKIF